MKIAWFSPFSRQSAIGEYSSIIVRELATYARLTVFASDLEGPGEAWLPDCDLRYLRLSSLDAIVDMLDDYDVIIYNLGNYADFHASIYATLQRKPGIVILHDVVMMHFFAGYYWQYQANIPDFVREMQFSHGEDGVKLAEKIVAQDLPDDFWTSPLLLEYSLTKSAIHGAHGIVVHSQYAQNRVQQLAIAPVARIDFPTPNIAAEITRQPSAAAPDGKVRLLSHGHIIPNKIIAEVIDAIGQRPALRAGVVYDVVGRPHPKYSRRLEQLIEQHQLQDVVRLTGYQPDEALYRYIAHADVIVALRNPHMGEASWVLLEATTLGKPTIVWKHGYYDEFPDDVVAKVDSLESLADTLETLAQDATLRQTLGRNAQAYAARTFNTRAYCHRLLAFIQTCYYHRPALVLTDIVSNILLELGAGYWKPTDLVDRLAGELECLIPPMTDFVLRGERGDE